MNKHHWTSIVVVSFLFLDPSWCYSQKPSSGFYIIIQSKSKCAHQVSALNGNKTYCLTKEPIITEAEFESVSEIRYDRTEGVKYLELKLSSDAFKTLKGLKKRLPDTDLALVVDRKVAGIFENQDQIEGRIIPIRGTLNSTEIDWIYRKLKKVKP